METFSALLAICAGNSPVIGAVNSLHKSQWRGALMFSLIGAWINGWVNNGGADDLIRHRTHYDVTIMARPLMIWSCLGLSVAPRSCKQREHRQQCQRSPGIIQFQQQKCCIFNVLNIFQSCVMIIHDFMGGFSGFGLSQWATTLHCNVVSHWLSPYPLYVHEVHISCVCGRRVPRVWHPILGGRAAVCDGWFCCCAGNKFGVGRKVGERTHRRPWAIPGLQKDALVHAAINGYCRKGVCS